MVVNNEASDIQKDTFLTLFPFIVDCLAFISLGSTYTTSFGCK